jgi:hypothetical protein
MSCSWKDLYRRSVRDHRPMQDLLAQAMRAAEASGSLVLKAQIKPYRVMPTFLLCQELDRFEVPTPDSDPAQPFH